MSLHCKQVDSGRAEMFLTKIRKIFVAGGGHFNICGIAYVDLRQLPLAYTAQHLVGR